MHCRRLTQQPAYKGVSLFLASLFSFSLCFALAHHFEISEQLLTKIRHKYGAPAEARIRRWQDLIHENIAMHEIAKLEVVNDFFNGARFVDDSKQWNKRDYWATPIEFLTHDAGDCEDFSIAKYFTLKEMGMDISKLRITYVKALTLNQAHMVLAYYPTPNSEPLILDNINKRIKPASERKDLHPVYSFNADALWLARSRNEQLKAGKPSQLNLWEDLTARMQKELL